MPWKPGAERSLAAHTSLSPCCPGGQAGRAQAGRPHHHHHHLHSHTHTPLHTHFTHTHYTHTATLTHYLHLCMPACLCLIQTFGLCLACFGSCSCLACFGLCCRPSCLLVLPSCASFSRLRPCLCLALNSGSLSLFSLFAVKENRQWQAVGRQAYEAGVVGTSSIHSLSFLHRKACCMRAGKLWEGKTGGLKSFISSHPTPQPGGSIPLPPYLLYLHVYPRRCLHT